MTKITMNRGSRSALPNESRIMKSFKVRVSGGRFTVHGFAQKIGTDLLISIWGGTRPHIGAVAMAAARPSLKNPEKGSATSSNFTFLGHKEDLLAKKISEKIASQVQAHVVVAAGLHWDRLTSKDIRDVETLTFQMADLILEKLKEGR